VETLRRLKRTLAAISRVVRRADCVPDVVLSWQVNTGTNSHRFVASRLQIVHNSFVVSYARLRAGVGTFLHYILVTRYSIH
jgi:hypothetical protein